MLVPKEQYGRTSAFTQLSEALPALVGPALAGTLYASIQLGKMALIDFASYAFSVFLMLLFVRIPNPAKSIQDVKGERSLWKEMRFGWDYIMARRGLLALLTFFLAINFFSGVINPLFTPLILDNWDAHTLGYLGTLLGLGMLAGTVIMSAWGGTKRKIFTLLGSGVASGMFFVGAGLRVSLPLLAVCGFGLMFTTPFMNAASQAIWQAKVAPDLQGRVFAIRRAIAWSASIISPLLAAPLADYLFKPAMAEGGKLAPVLGPIFGEGAGRGIGVMISLVGLLTVVVSLVGLTTTRLRRVELDLPDHDVATQATSVTQLAE
jgi:MFS family permease